MTTTHRSYTMEQIKRANRAAGQYWFEPDTMRFFDSRVESTTYGPDSSGTIYFVSSESRGFEPSSGRAYTVRSFDPSTGNVDTHGDFKEHDTRHAAHVAAAKAARS